MQIKHSPQPHNSDPAVLFGDIYPDILLVVHQACHCLGNHPRQAEFEDLVQQVCLLLIDNNYRALRSFNYQSSPRTWLFSLTRHYLSRQFQKKSREVSLEDLPSDGFSSEAKQDHLLAAQERARELVAVVSRLSLREQKLFCLLRQDGMTMSETAKEMGIKPGSIYKERSDLIKKIRKMIRR